MTTSKLIAKHLRQVYFGGNWTEVNLKDTLTSISYEMATTKMDGFNTILALAYHIHYFVNGVIPVFKGGLLEIRDKFSFEHPDVNSEEQWHNLLSHMWADAEIFGELLESFPEERWSKDFTDKKYGSYITNILGLIEHTHYHLGQIVIIKKMIERSV